MDSMEICQKYVQLANSFLVFSKFQVHDASLSRDLKSSQVTHRTVRDFLRQDSAQSAMDYNIGGLADKNYPS
jgi:hypothetical protein